MHRSSLRVAVMTVAGLSAVAGGIALAPIVAAAPYENCTAAREAGDTNIPSSSDMYGEHLDSDLDGIGCESN